MTVFSRDLQEGLEARYRVRMGWRYQTVEFLGLPYLKDEPPLTLPQIYVPLSFTWEAAGKERHYLPAMLEHQRHLVVLGDPGAGKSTLIKILAYSFGRIQPSPLARRLGAHIPVPIILRDYKVRGWQTAEDMLQEFIAQLDEDVRSEVTVAWLLDALTAGRGILLLDGLDEVGGQAERRHLRDQVIVPLLERMPQSLAVLTSRSIGYEEVPFDTMLPDPDRLAAYAFGMRRCYVAPFNDDDIDRFISKWYAARERDERERQRRLESLRQALKRSDRIRRLASNPSLLTLMTLIHRVTAELPSGRVKLYDKIVEAYLETIQRYRGLTAYEASLEEMKRWLAYVGWEMQSQRSANREQDGDLLVSRDQLLQWLTQAIATDRDNAGEEAASFLDYIARRSGLLIPRGPQQFAFVHLTFQEYFAAWSFRGWLRRFDTLVTLCAERMGNPRWHETLVLLFELLAEFPGAGDELVEALQERTQTQATQRRANILFAELLLDAQSGLSRDSQERTTRRVLAATCVEYNDAVIGRLRELTPERFDVLVRPWLDQQLQETKPEAMGEDFFLVAPAFHAYEVDWSEKLGTWVAQRGALAWSEAQIYNAVLTGGHNPDVCAWAAYRLPLLSWLSEFFASYNLNVNLADQRMPELFLVQHLSPKHRFLAQLSATYATSRLHLLHYLCLGVIKPRTVQESEIILTPVLAPALTRARALARARARALVLARAPALTRALALASARASALASALASATSPISPAPEWLTQSKGLATEVAWAERLFSTPDAPQDILQAHRETLEHLITATDDWSRLLGLTSLMLLGEGTPQRCAARNSLLDKGMQQASAFTFPEDVHEVTATAECQQDLPTLLQIIFLHQPGKPWLQPEWFDLAHPAARFFRASPREFFAQAAEVLDPHGETDLKKWRL